MAGKWSIPEVPHKGWTCTSVEDLSAPDKVFEMCETQDIRYVHHMEYPDYSESLAVGCVCAEHVENDYEGPRCRANGAGSAANGRSPSRDPLS